MFRRTAIDLGLDKVLENIAHYSLSSLGREKVLTSIPSFQREAYEKKQMQVSCGIYCLSRASSESIAVESFPDLEGVFASIAASPTSSLEGEQVYDVGLFIRAALALRRFFLLSLEEGCKDSDCGVHNLIEDIPAELLLLEQEIFRILESPGTVKENYPTVKALRDKADARRMDRSRMASQFIRDNGQIMQSSTAAMRDGRLVLPVRNEFRNQMDGYIQSTSQSGGTVFMEPFKLVDMNNAVVMAQQEIEIEIARLVGQLSAMVRECEASLRLLCSQVREADSIYAFSSWAKLNNCCKVLQSEENSCNLIRARHPLLGAKCVPIDLSIPRNLRAVVLTGPNAGGKTVTMKTVGLFALLNQICGYIPASDGSCMNLFDRVYTDIGDDQSIENHLSTFSGHMKSIGSILRSATRDSLVILDELGSGTDPQEGAALARSILEFCIDKGCLTFTTSHHGVLKQFAYASDIVLNASMEFDEKTLEPTFKVINGLPGESHAIDTARRMHLPKSVTSAAENYLGQEAVKISSIIRSLEQKRREAEKTQQDLAKRLRALENNERHIANEERRLRNMENSLKKGYLREYDDLMKDTRKRLENLVAELREGEITREKTRKVKDFISEEQNRENTIRQEIRSSEEELDESQLREDEESSLNVKLEAGMDVLCGPNKREGSIIKEAGRGKWIVAIGSMKFTFKETDLTVPRRTQTAKVTYMFDSHGKAPAPKFSMDLRGYRLLDALDAIDSQLEACCIHGLKTFSIVHGYGDGILSSGIHGHLKQSALVESYCFAHPDDGGQGKTYVNLK